jgi:small subunit ribosomal protein S16
MVTIRLSRGGAKKKPFYHIEVKDSRASRDGRYIERLGFYNPTASGGEQRLALDMERLVHWLSVGAGTSDSVKSLVKEASKQVAA